MKTMRSLSQSKVAAPWRVTATTKEGCHVPDKFENPMASVRKGVSGCFGIESFAHPPRVPLRL